MANKFSTGKNQYEITNYQYPSDLHDDSIYGGTKVVFFINVHKSSKFLPTLGETIDTKDLDTPRLRSMTIEQNISAREMRWASALAGSIGGAESGGMLALSALGVGSIAHAKHILGLAVGGLATGIAGGAVTSLPSGYIPEIAKTTTRETKRLATAIALHVPTDLNIRYSVNWGEEDLIGGALAASLVTKLADGDAGLMKSLQDVKVSSLNQPSQTSDVSPTQAMLAAGGLLKGNKISGYVSAKTGVAVNPKREMLFKSVDLRTFTFTYTFSPRSSTEAENVDRIIKTFKFHMHPEYIDSNAFLYLYPSEFDIHYYSNDKENQFIHQHTSCVLTEMSVNYTPNGSFTTFSTGMPTQINLSLTFKELMPATKESIGTPNQIGGL